MQEEDKLLLFLASVFLSIGAMIFLHKWRVRRLRRQNLLKRITKEMNNLIQFSEQVATHSNDRQTTDLNQQEQDFFSGYFTQKIKFILYCYEIFMRLSRREIIRDKYHDKLLELFENKYFLREIKKNTERYKKLYNYYNYSTR